MRKCIVLLILLGFWVQSWAQISVAMTADKDTILFGDQITISYKINLSEGVELTSLDFSSLKKAENLVYSQDTTVLEEIMDVNIIDGGIFGITENNLIVTKGTNNQTIPLSGQIVLRVSSIGVMYPPKPDLGHLSSVQEILLNSNPIFVKPIGEAMDIHPNWDIIKEPIKWTDYLYIVYILLAVVSIGLGIYFVTKRLNRAGEMDVHDEPAILLPAHIIALNDLDELKQAELWQKGDLKGYHTELTRIIRQYIENRFHINALEMTTSQLSREMKIQEIDATLIPRFGDILTIADKVKFAKGETGPEINAQFLGEAYDIVHATKESEKLDVNTND